MKKFQTFFGVLACYELAKTVFILVSRPLLSIVSLPFSWYAAAPLLLIPLLSAVLTAADPIKYCEYCFILILSKIMFLLSTLYYVIDTVSVRLRSPLTLDADTSQFTLILLIFFVFDGILCVVISSIGKKIRNVERDSEGSICK